MEAFQRGLEVVYEEADRATALAASQEPRAATEPLILIVSPRVVVTVSSKVMATEVAVAVAVVVLDAEVAVEVLVVEVEVEEPVP